MSSEYAVLTKLNIVFKKNHIYMYVIKTVHNINMFIHLMSFFIWSKSTRSTETIVLERLFQR